MSDLTPHPVPPPPPPPPPSVPGGRSYDFLRPFTFTFEDPNWASKVLMGGLFVLASFVIIGTFFIAGYTARLVRNVVAGERFPLPEWDDLGEYFGEGLRLFFIGFIYSLPVFVVGAFFFLPLVLSGALGHHVGDGPAFAMVMSMWCVLAPLSLALAVWMPAALLLAVVDRDFGAAFQFGRIAGFIRANLANYVIAVLIAFIARIAGGAGVMLCVVGVLFTSFWSILVTAYAFADVYRLSDAK